MTDSEVLLKVYQLWGCLRIRNPAAPEDLAARDEIRSELVERFGELPKRPRGDWPTRTDDGLEIVYNPRVVHGKALVKHAHEHLHDAGQYAHLHGPSTHAH